MSRLKKCFENLRLSRKKALIPYIMTADPSQKVTVPLMHAMVKAGANIIELGIPFSDPMADGPVIQAASERSLQHGTNLKTVFTAVKEFRKKDDKTPIVLMGYLNPIEVMGYKSFAEGASQCGVDGVITVDIPPEEAEEYIKALTGHQIDPVFLIAPTSTVERIAKIGRAASGFVYYVSLRGVTGAANLDVQSVVSKVKEIRQQIDLPVGVGFGISDAESAAAVAACADAVVVGSAIIKKMTGHDLENDISGDDKVNIIIKDVTELLSAMRIAMDANSETGARVSQAG